MVKALSKDQVQSIWDAYQHLGSVRAVASSLGISNATAHKYIKQRYSTNSPNIVCKLQNSSESIQGLYVGLWMGDGTQFIDAGQYIVKICCHSVNTQLNRFIEWIFHELFRKTTYTSKNKGRDGSYIVCSSKFIYQYIKKHALWWDYKSRTVHLRKEPIYHSDNFLRGVITGLMLSDGYLKKHAVYRTISSELVKDIVQILLLLDFKHPHVSRSQRKNKNWHDIYSIRLVRSESRKLKNLMDEFLGELPHQLSFHNLKYGYLDQ